ncbi:MAG TPA: enoyl-CoA hydratase-related protein [Caulobacteraceae bacterium]|nr:enoyl-CoA hydratase-related protein [Caulobacteraceae bacterium]
MLSIDKEGRVAVITLNRAEAAGAQPHSLREALHDAIDAVAMDDDVSVVLLTGREDGFPDGLNVSALGAEPLSASDHSPAEAIHRCVKPVLVAITGAAIAGGLELVLACDLIIASTSARFADTHAHVGAEPGPGFAKRLVQLIGPQRALELSLTGEFLEAEQGYEWGLVGRLTPPETLAATALHIAKEMARAPLPALIKRKALNVAATL